MPGLRDLLTVVIRAKQTVSHNVPEGWRYRRQWDPRGLRDPVWLVAYPRMSHPTVGCVFLHATHMSG